MHTIQSIGRLLTLHNGVQGGDSSFYLARKVWVEETQKRVGGWSANRMINEINRVMVFEARGQCAEIVGHTASRPADLGVVEEGLSTI